MRDASSIAEMVHKPVMLQEVCAFLSPRSGATYVDGTFGLGGYTEAFLKTADCRVLAFDHDPSAQLSANAFSKEYPDRFTFFNASFQNLKQHLHAQGIQKVDGLVLDLGVSSPQLDRPERGFSFRFDGPLDMRMSQKGVTAADVVNSYTEEDLANIIYKYGEERRSRAIARKIVQARQLSPILSTKALADLVQKVIPKRPEQKIHPATRTFQAFRIYVNKELEALETVLLESLEVLAENGRLVVVSFHSLEDRIVKQFLKERTLIKERENKYRPSTKSEAGQGFSLLTKKVVTATLEECTANPRARSAKLRAAIFNGACT